MQSRALLSCVLSSFAAGACSDDAEGPKDAPPPTTDIDNGSCGDQLRFTGEYVDWDFDANSCGIFAANFAVQGEGGMDDTSPNGRFDLCIPTSQETTILDVTNSTDPSACSDPQGTYDVPAIAVARKSVILGSGGAFSGRNFTTARRDKFLSDAGLPAFDPAKAYVFVHVSGTPHVVAIAAAHGAPQAIANGTSTWAAGDTGKEVFFADVTVGSGTTELTMPNGVGAGSIPLVAGKITMVSLIGL